VYLYFNNASKLVFYGKPFDVENVSKNIFRIKKIADKLTEENIKHCLHSLRFVNISTSKIMDLKKTVFDPKNGRHVQLLQDLWASMLPDARCPINDDKSPSSSISSGAWSDLGFQGKDPSTDFRGMGLLGLTQLVYFAKYDPEAAKRVLKVSLHPRRYFPYAG